MTGHFVWHTEQHFSLILDVRRELAAKIAALHVVGMHRLANDLDGLHDRLAKGETELREAIEEEQAEKGPQS